MPRLRTRVVASLMLVAVAACADGGSDGDDIAGTDETTTTAEANLDEATTTTEAEQSGDDVTAVPNVELLEEGSEPRVELRYEFEEGSVVSLTNTTTIDQTIGGESTGPLTTTQSMQATVVRIDGTATDMAITYGTTSVEGGPTTPAEVLEGAREGAAAFDGATAELRASSVGEVLDVDVQLAAGAPASVEQFVSKLVDSFEQQAVAFPIEAVGVGARWRTSIDLDFNGLTATVQQTFAVVAIDDEGVDVEVEVAGTFSGIATGRSRGAGTARVTFDSFFPELDVTTENAIEAQGTTIDQSIHQQISRR